MGDFWNWPEASALLIPYTFGVLAGWGFGTAAATHSGELLKLEEDLRNVGRKYNQFVIPSVRPNMDHWTPEERELFEVCRSRRRELNHEVERHWAFRISWIITVLLPFTPLNPLRLPHDYPGGFEMFHYLLFVPMLFPIILPLYLREVIFTFDRDGIFEAAVVALHLPVIISIFIYFPLKVFRQSSPTMDCLLRDIVPGSLLPMLLMSLIVIRYLSWLRTTLPVGARMISFRVFRHVLRTNKMLFLSILFTWTMFWKSTLSSSACR